MNNSIYAAPNNVTDIHECDFYHTMDLPCSGTVKGPWDLRGREPSYLGHVDVKGKTILEIGPASGHLSFYMEQQGGQVVSCDLSDQDAWDVVPYATHDTAGEIERRKAHIRRLNNSYWFAHRAFQSQARVVYGSVYRIPAEIGEFDIGTCCSVLLHVRDPFLALQTVAEHVRESVIITDIPLDWKDEFFALLHTQKHARFLPNAATGMPNDSWWYLSPEVVAEFIRILGFTHIELSYHSQRYQNKDVEMYTIVGHRTTVPAQSSTPSPFSVSNRTRYLATRFFRGIRRRIINARRRSALS